MMLPEVAEGQAVSGVRLDVRAWGIWLGVLVIAALLIRNPYYQVLVGVGILMTWPQDAEKRLLKVGEVLRFGAFALLFSVVFNALTVHSGQTVLGSIPGKIPLLSGDVTLEAAAYGASNGLTILLILLIFSRFSAAIDYAEVLRFVPTALFEMGLIVSISFTLIPNLRRTWRDIQESQALRGHRVRGMRDLPPLLVPLVVNSLERAFGLAEAMEARGYARRGTGQANFWGRFLLVGSLLGTLGLLLLNTFWTLPRWGLWGGLVLCGACLWVGLRRQKLARTYYKVGVWTWRESLMAGGMVVFLAVILMVAPQSLNFMPYPRLAWPLFDPWLACVMLVPMLPSLLETP